MTNSRRIFCTLVLLPLLPACNNSTGSGGSEPSSPPRYIEYPIKAEQVSAAFLAVGDLDGNSDNGLEIILSTLVEAGPPGPPTALSRGALRRFNTQGCNMLESRCLEGPWVEDVLISTTDLQGYAFINTPQIADINGDTQNDIIVQTGFLSTAGGAHFWLDGNELDGPLPPSHHFFSPAHTTPLTSGLFFWHESAQGDLDGDGLPDIITTSGKTQSLQNPLGSPDGSEVMKVEWYRQTAPGEFEYHTISAIDGNGDLISSIGGVFIKLHDVDNDGDDDIVLSQFLNHTYDSLPPETLNPSLVWLENRETPSQANGWQGIWHYHIIDNTIGLGYHMEFVDIDHDGREELVVDSHNNDGDPRWQDAEGNTVVPPGLYWFEIPDNPTAVSQWEKHVISTDFGVTLYYGNPASQGVPGIFNVGDINNDGLLDVAVPGDGNSKLYAFIQRPDGSFREDIVDEAKMFGMALVADIDGDGRNEIIAAQHNSLDMDPATSDSLDDLSLPPGKLSIYQYSEAE